MKCLDCPSLIICRIKMACIFLLPAVSLCVLLCLPFFIVFSTYSAAMVPLHGPLASQDQASSLSQIFEHFGEIIPDSDSTSPDSDSNFSRINLGSPKSCARSNPALASQLELTATCRGRRDLDHDDVWYTEFTLPGHCAAKHPRLFTPHARVHTLTDQPSASLCRCTETCRRVHDVSITKFVLAMRQHKLDCRTAPVPVPHDLDRVDGPPAATDHRNMLHRDQSGP